MAEPLAYEPGPPPVVNNVIFTPVRIDARGSDGHGYSTHSLGSCSVCGSVVEYATRWRHLRFHDSLTPGYRHRDATEDKPVAKPYVPLAERFVQDNPDLFPKG